MAMKYFHETERNSAAVQTSGKEVTIISVMSSMLCVKLDVMTRDVVAGWIQVHTTYLPPPHGDLSLEMAASKYVMFDQKLTV